MPPGKRDPATLPRAKLATDCCVVRGPGMFGYGWICEMDLLLTVPTARRTVLKNTAIVHSVLLQHVVVLVASPRSTCSRVTIRLQWCLGSIQCEQVPTIPDHAYAADKSLVLQGTKPVGPLRASKQSFQSLKVFTSPFTTSTIELSVTISTTHGAELNVDFQSVLPCAR